MTKEDKPDGGLRAWSIVVASFFISIQDGIGFSFGVFLPNLNDYFGVTKAATAVIFSIMSFLVQGSGPVASYFVRSTSYRMTCLTGALISTISFLTTALLLHLNIKSLGLFYFLTGGLSGLGMGFVFMVARTITTEWFDTRLGLASGIAQAGVGLGQFVLPPLADTLMEKWGLVRTFLILSGVTASGLGFGLLYSVPQTENRNEKKVNGNLKTLLKDPQMICFLVSCFLDCLGSYSVFAYTSENAISLGLDSGTSSWIFSGLGVGGFIGRIAGGHICDVVRSKLDDRKVVFVLIVGKVFASIAIFFLGILTNSFGQISFSVLFGFVFGSYCSSIIVYLKTFSDDLGTAYGVYLFVSSLSSIVSPALVGFVYDTWKNYRIAYFSLAGTVLFSSLILGLVPLRYQKKKNYLAFESE